MLRHHLTAFLASERGLKNGRVILGHTLALQQRTPSRCFLMGTLGLHLHRHLSTYSPLFLAKEWGVDSLLVVTVQQLYSFSILVQNVCCLMGGRRLGFIFPSVSTRLTPEKLITEQERLAYPDPCCRPLRSHLPYAPDLRGENPGSKANRIARGAAQ